MSFYQKNIDFIKSKIDKKCNEIGKDSSELTLIAVSKFHSIESIEEVRKFGIIDFGENKAQELEQKAKVLTNKINWHFIGHLQTNKVKIVVPYAEIIHSVDSIKLADEINKRADNFGKIQRIFLEVKTSEEESKYGLADFQSLTEIAEYCSKLSSIKLEGLMTMAPYTDDTEVVRDSFKKLANYRNRLNEKDFMINHLSMGMTNDFEIAIEEGATMLRIGTAIFGERDYSNN